MNKPDRAREPPANIKDIMTARFQNPKFVYDGKRVQPVYDRQSYDYSAGYIYRRHLPICPMGVSAPSSISPASQILTIPPPSASTAHQAATTKFVHASANKFRSPINSVLWNQDGRRLLTGSSSGEVTMWNGFGFNFDTILQAHESPVRAMCWAPSASFLITSDSAGIVKYWNPSMNNIQMLEAHKEGVKDLSFSYNDTKFCTASDDATVKIWDSVQCRAEATLTGHNWDVRKAQWHPTRALIASGGKDNLLKLWDPREGRCFRTVHYHKNSISSLKFLGEEYLLTGGKDQVVKMMDLRAMRECFTYKSPGKEISALAVHPHGGLFATGTGDGEVLMWERWVEGPIGRGDEKHEGTIWSMDFHPGGHVLATGSADLLVKFWMRGRPGGRGEAAAGGGEEEWGGVEEGVIPGI